MFPAQIQTAVRQIERWLVASRQDRHPAIAMLHADYAMGDVDLVRQLWTDQEVVAATGKDMRQLNQQAAEAQDAAKRRIVAIAPQLDPTEEDA